MNYIMSYLYLQYLLLYFQVKPYISAIGVDIYVGAETLNPFRKMNKRIYEK